MTELRCLTLDGHTLDIRPAPGKRDWMEATPQRFAYRCLPLTLANACGWEILVPETFTAVWTGKPGLDAVILSETRGTPALSHFGNGVLTFHVNALFRTDPGISLMVRGPMNRPKDGIAALDAVVETWWSPFTFTMNWMFTRPHHPVTFEAGEPFCHLLPIDIPAIAATRPIRKPLASEPETKRKLDAWSASREAFNQSLKDIPSEQIKEDWQKHYSQGVDLDGDAPDGRHFTKLRLSPFKDES
ncbi:DUF6065 family protein [Jannaschia seohaensis]|uniref:Uncharacterized protein n=1 Tax=Jannaschia seohaensis TaxID=475081 RepID=A0A2Y9AC14_9RHOB|nr:DUF6065 family protein [Jannaschia seohaensis]PWJ21325.1 hypothetical protein BCF38_102576 [Jannaschia seohaensis]SSA41735.1 hypothetical protein SAMN05421539_102576 [Jannaschia seohaensis]